MSLVPLFATVLFAQLFLVYFLIYYREDNTSTNSTTFQPSTVRNEDKTDDVVIVEKSHKSFDSKKLNVEVSSNTPNMLLLLQNSMEPIKSNKVDISKLNPNEIAIVQYDSRPLDDYWLASASWNNYYCKKHGHEYIHYTLLDNNDINNNKLYDVQGAACMHGTELLASPWCKVRAMLEANNNYKHIKLFIYMDSDAVVSKLYENFSLGVFLGVLQSKLDWDVENKPIIFNQDGPCWWCGMIKGIGYTTCLNAGTVLWYRHDLSLKVLQEWWDSSMDSYDNNPIRRPFRRKWPWEQDRQMALYHRNPNNIQIASHPDKPHMEHKAGWTDWCLSHLPSSGCFISHHCENKNSKNNMIRMYTVDERFKSIDRILLK